MEQELRGWENCDPSPFGEPSYIETHVSTSPPLGLMLLDQIPKVIFHFELGSYLVLLQFILGLIWLCFLVWELVFRDLKTIIISTRTTKTTSHLTYIVSCHVSLHCTHLVKIIIWIGVKIPKQFKFVYSMPSTRKIVDKYVGCLFLLVCVWF
jgi:hypothetical protein